MKILRTGGRECFTDLPLEVNWSLTMKCNYRCSYCFHYGKGKNPPPQLPFSTLEQLKTAVDNIASLNRPWYDITLCGGEPTIHPHIFDIISMLHETLGERLNYVLIITNGSRNESFYRRLADIAKIVDVRMNISIHTDHVEMDHILKLIENLSNDITMNFSLMFNPDKRELVYKIYNTLLEYRKKYWFSLNIILLSDGDHIDLRHTKEDLAWRNEALQKIHALEKDVSLKFPPRKKIKHGRKLIRDIEENNEVKTIPIVDRRADYAKGFFDFKGMYCVAQASVLRIQENGICRGMVCSDDRNFYNIYDKNCFKVARDKFIHAVICSQHSCVCSSNDKIPKFASAEEAKKYVKFAQKRQAELFAEYDAAQQGKSAQKKQAELSNEQKVAQSLTKNSNNLPRITANEIIGMSEDSLSNYFGEADVVRKITEYEYNSGDKNSKVVYKVQDGIVTEITCSLK